MRSLEECAAIVLRKWPQTDEFACPGDGRWPVDLVVCGRCGGSAFIREAITPADLLADDDGRPSKWLWALWSKRVGWLTPPDFEGDKWCCTTGPNERIQGLGDTATEAITRALCALAEAS